MPRAQLCFIEKTPLRRTRPRTRSIRPYATPRNRFNSRSSFRYDSAGARSIIARDVIDTPSRRPECDEWLIPRNVLARIAVRYNCIFFLAFALINSCRLQTSCLRTHGEGRVKIIFI